MLQAGGHRSARPAAPARSTKDLPIRKVPVGTIHKNWFVLWRGDYRVCPSGVSDMVCLHALAEIVALNCSLPPPRAVQPVSSWWLPTQHVRPEMWHQLSGSVTGGMLIGVGGEKPGGGACAARRGPLLILAHNDITQKPLTREGSSCNNRLPFGEARKWS